MVLVANKADLEQDRVVSYQEGEDITKQLKVGSARYLLTHMYNFLSTNPKLALYASDIIAEELYSPHTHTSSIIAGLKPDILKADLKAHSCSLLGEKSFSKT